MISKATATALFLASVCLLECFGLVRARERGVGEDSASSGLCVKSSGDVCRIPFGAVLSQKAVLMGRVIAVRGYLTADQYGFAVYETKEMARIRAREGSLLVRGGNVDSSMGRYEGKYVVVIGVLGNSEMGHWGAVDLKGPLQQAAVRQLP